MRMAPSKQVTEAPRFLFPRLTWSGNTPRLAVSPLVGAQQQQHQRLSIGLGPRRERQLYHSPFSLYSSSFSPPPSRYTVSTTSSSAAASPFSSALVAPLENPIRYNGVYVAAFHPARRAFHASAVRRRDYHFDTLKFVRQLKDEGFSEEQAVAIMRVLSDVIQESIQNLTRTMALREGECVLLQFSIDSSPGDSSGAA
jgi:Protein of unknown function (DUF1640)